MINKCLEKISWKTRRVTFKFALGYMTYDTDRFTTYSLFKFECRFPNKITVKRFTVDNWDLFFLKTPFRRYYIHLTDKRLWNRYYLTRWERFALNVLRTILLLH